MAAAANTQGGLARRALLLGALLVLASCAGPYGRSGTDGDDAGEVGPPQGLTCVPYARQVSGIDIRGDAWVWWDAAAGRYARGLRPEPGAVLVMQATRVMRRGHLAVVETVVSEREIRVTQANWGNDAKTRGRVETGTPVVDVSADNSWQAVRVWNRRTQAYGRVNPTFGFIYSRAAEVAWQRAGAASQLAACRPGALPDGG